MRDYATRPVVDLAVARGKAADIIKSPFNGSSIPAREIQMGLKMGQVNAKTLQMPLHKAVTLLEDKNVGRISPAFKTSGGQGAGDGYGVDRWASNLPGGEVCRRSGCG